MAQGCSARTDLMDYPSAPGLQLPTPADGNAIVVFLRPGQMAGAASSTVFEDENLIAVLMDETYAVYETAPGQHRFMVLGEAADFMDADVEGGKVYFARVVPRSGVWRPRFSLAPVTKHDPEWHLLRAWMTKSSRITLNSAGRFWAQENAPSISEKHDAYLERWLAKDESERPMLYAEDGVPVRDFQ